MKTIPAVVLLVCMSYGAAALAQAQPPLAASLSTTSSAQSMTKAEQIKQLKPATNIVELMQLLNTLHTQVLLTDPSFMEDDNIHRLFGGGVIKAKASKVSRLIFKELIPSPDNPFQFRILISGVKEFPGSGSLMLGDYKTALPINHELIETYLLPGVKGFDPYDPTKFMTNETRNIAGGLPLKKHPKGYWRYRDGELRSGFRNSIAVVLDLSANALIIKLQQNEEEK